MVHFVGAGCGASDLITVRGARLLGEADVIIYAGSLVNPALLDYAKPDCEIHDSAYMTLEEVIDVIKAAEAAGTTTVRLHTGDSSIYGACPTCPRPSSSPAWRAAPPCPPRKRSALWPSTRPP